MVSCTITAEHIIQHKMLEKLQHCSDNIFNIIKFLLVYGTHGEKGFHERGFTVLLSMNKLQ